MKRYLPAVGLCLTMLVPSSVAFAEIKIAFVNAQNAIMNTTQAQQFLAQLEEEFQTEQDSLRQIETDVTALLERLQKDGEVMSDAEKRKLNADIEEKRTQYAYEGQRLQRQLEARQNELFEGTQDKLRKAIEELVKSDDYDAVLPRQSVFYINEMYDITGKVTELLNEMNKQ